MTDLPPVQYLDEAARAFSFPSWTTVRLPEDRSRIITHARALHENAQLRAEIAALRPRETLEDVARREAAAIYKAFIDDDEDLSTADMIARGFLRAAEMAKAGELPDE